MLEVNIRMSELEKQKIKYEKNTEQICLTMTTKENTKKCKNHSNNTLKKRKDNKELKNVMTDVVPNFIKDKTESFWC